MRRSLSPRTRPRRSVLASGTPRYSVLAEAGDACGRVGAWTNAKRCAVPCVCSALLCFVLLCSAYLCLVREDQAAVDEPPRPLMLWRDAHAAWREDVSASAKRWALRAMRFERGKGRGGSKRTTVKLGWPTVPLLLRLLQCDVMLWRPLPSRESSRVESSRSATRTPFRVHSTGARSGKHTGRWEPV